MHDHAHVQPPLHMQSDALSLGRLSCPGLPRLLLTPVSKLLLELHIGPVGVVVQVDFDVLAPRVLRHLQQQAQHSVGTLRVAKKESRHMSNSLQDLAL